MTSRASSSMLVVPLLLLLLPGCECQNYTLYTTNASYPLSPTITPDQHCALANNNDTNFVYRAVVMLSYRRDLPAMFLNGSSFQNLQGESLGSSFLSLNFSKVLDSNNGTVVGSAPFWTGADNSLGNFSQCNCADFTDQASNTVQCGTRSGGLSAGSCNCNELKPFLCAKGTNFSDPATLEFGSAPAVYVFLSSYPVNPQNIGADFDPDAFCKNESAKSPLFNGSGVVVQSVAFTARRQNLRDMFPSNTSIYDLDGHFLAADAPALFERISPVSMRSANGTIKDVATTFWTGTRPGDKSGNHSSTTCGGFYSADNNNSNASYGKLMWGIHVGELDCHTYAHFLCAANVLPYVPPNGTFGATYLYFSDPVVIGTDVNATVNPDGICKNAANGHSKLLAGRDQIALVLTSTRTSLDNISANVVEDLSNNTLASNLNDFLSRNVTTQLLTTPNGTRVDIDVQFWSPLALNNCDNYTNNSILGTANMLMNGNGANLFCTTPTRFLCASFALPTLQPTLHPTLQPTTSAPTQQPTSAPTPIPATANATWNGTQTVLVVGGNGTQPVEVTIAPDIVFGQNGSVQVVLLGNNNKTISTVVSVVFRDATGDVVNVTNLSNPVTVSFPISTSLADVKHCVETAFVNGPLYPQCGYHNTSTNTWETNGCNVSSINSSWVQCSCTHLTDFAVLAPKSNRVVPKDTLELTSEHINQHPTGLIAVLVILTIFGVVFVLAWRRDRKEATNYEELRNEKQAKWASFRTEKKKFTFVKQIKIAFQKRHTWFSLIYRKKGTSFKSVDRTFVALLTVFVSMSMSALFHAQDNNKIGRAVAWILTVCVCLVPSQVLMALFVRTGEMGFYEEWEYMSIRRELPTTKCGKYHFPEFCRYVWRAMTVIAVIGMIVSVLTMSMNFDLEPFYYCQGEPAQAWVATWLAAYATTVFVYEPLRVLVLAAFTYYADTHNLDLKSMTEMATTAISKSKGENRGESKGETKED